MTNSRIEEITRAARTVAHAHIKGCPVSWPPFRLACEEEAKLWQERFDRAVKGVE